ncbi:hypothetical protein Bca52824_085088 [Brassica carinata]|uniref:Hpc2-related domain-containing protein n=1 Tax=Brassica carinata TaxID=52824 RepID=A0A8X7PQJ9_BRACI|nr:hypothetical protein Bca52824_085088 [Brassica carinata]
MGETKAATDGGSASGESSKPSAKLLTAGDRKLLKVELRQGETTYVSWKKLMKEASKGNCSLVSAIDAPPPNANPNLESRIAPGVPVEGETVDQPHSNRFNAVIEKIERLYMGRDSSDGEELDGAPDDDEYDTEDSFIDDVELDEYFEVDDSAIKHDGFFVNKGMHRQQQQHRTNNQRKGKGKSQQNLAAMLLMYPVNKPRLDQSAASGLSPKKKSNDPKTVQDSVSPLKVQSGNDSLSLENVKHSDKANHQPRNTTSPKSKAAESSVALHLKCSKRKSRPIVLEKSTVARQKENNGMHDQDNATVSRQSNQITKKGGSNVKPKTSTLEKAFRELEKVVAESRPPAATDNQDADTSSQVVKRRLPGDVKLKLAKVARIAQASQGNLSGELINRLMSIVGHLIQVRSLKRNLKIMIDSSDSAKRENDTRFQSIKNEVIETLKTQVPLMEPQATNQEAGTSDDFENPPPSTKKKFVMDEALEDKLCDLYDIFVDGLDEDSGPQIRKLYANLAELWPNRLMDNHGIKRAICRAKERRRALHANLGKEMCDHSSVLFLTAGSREDEEETDTIGTKSESTACPDKASGVGDKTTGVVPSATTTSLVHTQPTVDKSRDKSKQKHEKLKGSSSSSDPSGEAKAARRKKEKSVEDSHPPTVKQQIRPQAPLDLNLPN